MVDDGNVRNVNLKTRALNIDAATCGESAIEKIASKKEQVPYGVAQSVVNSVCDSALLASS